METHPASMASFDGRWRSNRAINEQKTTGAENMEVRPVKVARPNGRRLPCAIRILLQHGILRGLLTRAVGEDNSL